MSNITLPSISADGSLKRYLSEIGQFPILQKDEEYTLAKNWVEHEDIDAAHTLVTSHLRLVAKIAMGYRGYGLPISDLISEGNIGLMKAVKRFDPDKGFRLATYALLWIKAAIQEHILHSWSLVKIGTTSAQKKLFFNLRRIKNELKVFDEKDLSPETVKKISQKLVVDEQEVINMNQRIGGDYSLNAPRTIESSDGDWQEVLVDEKFGLQIQEKAKQLGIEIVGNYTFGYPDETFVEIFTSMATSALPSIKSTSNRVLVRQYLISNNWSIIVRYAIISIKIKCSKECEIF